jgi:hypothetical protein
VQEATARQQFGCLGVGGPAVLGPLDLDALKAGDDLKLE